MFNVQCSMEEVIPKIIHYCWFGRNPLPKSAKKCIASWKKYLPDYEIKEWNENNFDVNIIPYTRDAYGAKKYAFVSDYARFWILYHYGGVYFDTDVEVIRPIDDLIEKGAFMGWEKPNNAGTPSIAPGLGLAAPKGQPFYEVVLDGFINLNFYKKNGDRNPYTMIPMVTDILIKRGLTRDDSLQIIDDIFFYPSEYFCPMNAITGRITITENTYTIHWYSMSWLLSIVHLRVRLMRIARRLFSIK